MLTSCKCLWESKSRHRKIQIWFEMNFAMGQKIDSPEKIFKITTLSKQDFLLVHSTIRSNKYVLMVWCFLCFLHIIHFMFFVHMIAYFFTNFWRQKICKIKDFSFRFCWRKNMFFLWYMSTSEIRIFGMKTYFFKHFFWTLQGNDLFF